LTWKQRQTDRHSIDVWKSAHMYRLLIILIKIFNVQCLICPIYNLFNNETNHSSQYTFIRSERNVHRCLGIYFFDQQTIRIRQLAFVDDYENRYENQTDCSLDIDRMGTSLLCRCNSDNCTLNWKMNSLIDKKFPIENRQINFNNQIWLISLLLIVFGIFLLLIYVLFRLLKSRQDKVEKDIFYENLSSMLKSMNFSHQIQRINRFFIKAKQIRSIVHRQPINTKKNSSLLNSITDNNIKISLKTNYKFYKWFIIHR